MGTIAPPWDAIPGAGGAPGAGAAAGRATASGAASPDSALFLFLPRPPRSRLGFAAGLASASEDGGLASAGAAGAGVWAGAAPSVGASRSFFPDLFLSFLATVPSGAGAAGGTESFFPASAIGRSPPPATARLAWERSALAATLARSSRRTVRRSSSTAFSISWLSLVNSSSSAMVKGFPSVSSRCWSSISPPAASFSSAFWIFATRFWTVRSLRWQSSWTAPIVGS